MIAVEANPELCEAASRRFSEYVHAGRLEVVNLGIAQSAGRMDFYINDERTEWSSFHENISARDGGPVRRMDVEVVTLDTLMDRYGTPYYAKIDIEGNDEYALRSLLASRHRVPYVSVENGSTMLKDFLGTPYDAFKYVQQNNIHQLEQPLVPLEGRPVKFDFEFGASGFFGEDLEGSWQSYDEILPVISEVWDVETGAKNPDWDDSVGGWFDLHARRSDYNEVLMDLLEQGS